MEDIRAILADMPTYGYRRVHAILRHYTQAYFNSFTRSPQNGIHSTPSSSRTTISR